MIFHPNPSVNTTKTSKEEGNSFFSGIRSGRIWKRWKNFILFLHYPTPIQSLLWGTEGTSPERVQKTEGVTQETVYDPRPES